MRYSNCPNRPKAKMIDIFGIIAFITLFLSVAFIILPLSLDREAYRLQLKCEAEVKQGYPVGPCNYWEGERP